MLLTPVLSIDKLDGATIGGIRQRNRLLLDQFQGDPSMDWLVDLIGEYNLALQQIEEMEESLIKWDKL